MTEPIEPIQPTKLTKSNEELLVEIKRLKTQVEEFNEVLHALGRGEVDALVVTGPKGEHVFALEEKDNAYRILIEAMNDGAVTLASDGTILYCNRHFAEMARYPLEKVIGSSIYRFIPEADQATFKVLQQNLGRGELILQAKDGSTIPVYVSFSKLQLSGSQVFCVVITDLTEQKRKEEIIASEKLARSIIEQATEAIIVCDDKGRIIRHSHAAEQILGADPSLRNFEKLFNLQLSSEEKLSPSAMALQGEVLLQIEVSFERADGRQFYLLLDAGPLRNAEDKIIGCVITLSDITERKQAGEQLHRARDDLEIRVKERTAELDEQHGRLQAIVDSLPIGLWVADATGKMILINDVARHIWGGEAPCAKNVEEYGLYNAWWADTGEKIAAEDMPLARALKGETIKEKAVRFKRFDDTCGIQLISAAPVRDSKGSILGSVSIVQDITERKMAEEALKLAGAYNRSLIEASLDLLVTIGPDGKITDVNEATINVTGSSREQLIGTDFSNYFTEPEKAREGYQKVFANGFITDYPLTIRHRNGRLTDVLYNASIYKDAQGQVLGVFAAARDVTERKQIAEKLEAINSKLIDEIKGHARAKAELQAEVEEHKKTEIELVAARDDAEEAVRAKAAFLANMSHELRTPMNSIIGFTSLLLGEPLSPEHMDWLETIRMNGEALLTLINDILDFSKLEKEKIELELYPFDLYQHLDVTLDLISTKAAEKGLDLAYIIDENVPEAIISDSARLRQILANLLSNAVKFTDHGEVVITITSKPEGESHEIHFAVQDTGIGIPQDQMNKLFQPFSQIISIARLNEGTGLGLAISRKLVEVMGGRIWAESEVGKGSTFYFTIKAEAAPDDKPRKILIGLQPQLAKRSILIVDDNKSIRRILEHQTKSWGMIPIIVSSGYEALDLIRKGGAFDIAILDVSMPDMDGITLADTIRKYRSDLPLIMLTSIGQHIPSDLPAISLAKPVKPTQLYNTLTAILAGRPIQMKNQSPVANHVEISPLRILLAEDNVSSQKVVLGMLRRLGYRADMAANGVEVLQALERQPYDVVLMDIKMPEMDGFEATRQIRQRWPNNGPRIIAITAYALKGDKEKCLAAGMDDYIAKPVQMNELADALSRCPSPPPKNKI